MLKLAVCDSDIVFAENLARLLSQVSGSRNIAYFNSAEKAKAYTDMKKVDCFFMDIELGGGSGGIDVAYEIISKHPDSRVVFVSPYNHEYLSLMFKNSPEMIPFAYLQKPPKAEVVKKICEKIEKDLEYVNHNTHYLIKTQKGTTKLALSKIEYIECFRRKAIFACCDGVRLECYKKLSEIIQQLPQNFTFCHKSYIVNTDRIERYKSTQFTMDNGEIIPISRAHSKAMRAIIYARTPVSRSLRKRDVGDLPSDKTD